jgi:hypothetical protein
MWGRLFWSELRIADILLIIVILIFIAFNSVHYANNKQVKSVFVYKDNHLQGEYPLGIDATIVIDEHNTIEIFNQQVRMIETDCPDKRCVKQGFSSSLPIICLPNHLIIEIKADDKEKMLILQ